MPTPHSLFADLQTRLTAVTLRDQHRLARRIDGARRVRDPQARQAIVEQIAADVAAAEQRADRRRRAVPRIDYPAELPVTQRRDEIMAAIRDNQVVVVAGETGSGKTTQLPKMCLELGRGVRGMIGHTQPRRLAARTVVEWIAVELGTPLGGAVGYKVRFTDQVGDGTLIKLMTDGILLAELGQDRMLRQYDTLIIDEAHERSLNIDFILGYLKRLLPRRPDLKVIITSATIDPERFSHHFGGAPVIEVSGRTYPVEVRYRPLVADGDEEPRDQVEAVCAAVDELVAAGPGDILVFLSGEREIRDTADALARQNLPNTEILPLYARLSTAEQHRVFQPHTGRRIVLATNVAETSLTVPGIKYVIDPGTARISRYSRRTKVQRLPIEPISQASANQRAGRCGRTSDGVCIRLYSEADFLARPKFTDPEILRTNLASVILQMTALGLGDVADFPFVDPPDQRSVTDGVRLLEELGALDPTQSDPRRRLTPLGRRLARLPVDPRLGRMVLEADRNGCVREVMIIVAALSIQDPRERPVDRQQAAAEKHARFVDPDSDFLTYLNLWRYLREKQKELSSNQFRALCRAEFLNYLRVREWQDIYSQLRQVAATVGITVNTTPAEPQQIHVSLLAGLLSHVGCKDTERRARQPGRPVTEYLGARNARFAIFPGSALARKQPQWVMAAELVETSRLWARVVARIEPEWVEPLAQHLVHRSYSEPHWDSRRGAVLAYERVTLYGVPLVASRPVNYGRVDPAAARQLFIRHALVEGDWQTHHRFFHHNRALLAEVEELENRARRRDIVVDEQTLFDFYDRRVGAEVVSARHFDSWWKKVSRSQPDLLTFDRSMVISPEAGDVRAEDFPDVWEQGDLRLPLSYRFEPGTDGDGVTVHIPLSVLNQVSAEDFAWQVPGLREDLVTALIRSLPKQLRRHFVPVPEYAAAVLKRVRPRAEPLLAALERELGRMGGVTIPRDSWRLDRVPDHLRITFQVVDGRQRVQAAGKDLDVLKLRLTRQTRAALSVAADNVERRGLRGWTVGSLPRTVERLVDGQVVRAYPALVDEGDSVAVRLMDTEASQRQAMWRGTNRLLRLTVPSPFGYVRDRLSNQAKLTLTRNPHGSVAALVDDCVSCAIDKLVADHGGPAWDEAGFAALHAAVRSELAPTTLAVITEVEKILTVAHEIDAQRARLTGDAVRPALADVAEQMSGLIHPGFVTAAGYHRLADLHRYLRAVQHRLTKVVEDPYRDWERMLQVEQVRQSYLQLLDRLPPGAPVPDELREIRWMIEELRVSYFAQTLGTAYPVSDRRIFRAMDRLGAQVAT